MPRKKVVKSEVKVDVAPAVAAPVAVPEKLESQKIWDEIKEVNLNMFALPGQTVEKYCTPYMIEPSKCYVTVKVTAALVALEEALLKKFNIEVEGKFIVITRK